MSHEVKVRPHHDLLNLAFYHKGIIEQKASNNVLEAIALDCMSCLIALAFSVEGLINFVGAEKVPEWKERDSFGNKMKAIAAAIGWPVNEGIEPFITINQLKSIRDSMAHGKPILIKRSESSREALKRDMRAPWDDYLTVDFTLHAFRQVKSFEEGLLVAAKTELWDTLTSGSGAWTDA